MTENYTRSIIKAISWRFFATATTMILVLIFTGQWVLSLSIGFFEVTSKLILYYAHERIWNRIYWGKHNKLPVDFSKQE
jgi:adenylylsulfate kinase